MTKLRLGEYVMSKNVVYSLVFVLIGVFGLAVRVRRVESIGTIYIRADGSVDPPTANITSLDNITYTFTDNINDSIVVERSNIIINGDGYTVEGAWTIDSKGLYLSGVSNVTIKNTNIKRFFYGISLYESSDSHISGNTITNNQDGIYLSGSSNNSISGNNITNNADGIWLDYSSNSSISGNNITNNTNGIFLYHSSNSSISGNNITNNEYGIYPYYSSNNTVSGNNITNNMYGIYLSWSSDNTIYHNDFVDNTEQVRSEYSINVWDDGYPSGGNYWSDYKEKYPNATEINDSGIWDTPYIIDENNQDNYPIVPEFPSFLIMPLFMIATILAVIVYRRKHPV